MTNRLALGTALLAASLVFASTARAEDAALPALPPPPAAAPARAPAELPQPVKTTTPAAGRGFVLTLGSGGSFLAGAIAKSVPISGAQLTFDIRIGAYFTQRFGVLAGVQGGYGALFDGCASTCSNAFSYQLPVVAQYSFHDRRRGAYVEGGLGLLSTYGASTGKDASTPETLLVKTDADLKLGIGYRIAKIDPASTVDTTTGVDIRFGVDLGRFDHVEYHSVDGDADGAIQPAMKALHYAFALSVGYHFTP